MLKKRKRKRKNHSKSLHFIDDGGRNVQSKIQEHTVIVQGDVFIWWPVGYENDWVKLAKMVPWSRI